jgi:hypothetical protein
LRTANKTVAPALVAGTRPAATSVKIEKLIGTRIDQQAFKSAMPNCEIVQ